MEGITQRQSFKQIIQKDFKINNDEEYYQHMTTTDEYNNYPLAGDIEIHALSIISEMEIKVYTHQGGNEYTEYRDFNNQILQDTKPHTVAIAFNPMAQHYDGIEFPKLTVSHQKEQEAITTKEPKQKIITEEIRRDKLEGRKRKRNEHKIKNTEEQQPIEWLGKNSYKSKNEPKSKNKQPKQEEYEESNYATIENKDKETHHRKQYRKRAYNKSNRTVTNPNGKQKK
jgi:hypothetical protein